MTTMSDPLLQVSRSAPVAERSSAHHHHQQQQPLSQAPGRMQSDGLPTAADSGNRHAPNAAAAGERGTKTTWSAGSAANVETAAAAGKPSSVDHDLKPADRRPSEPVRLTTDESRAARGETAATWGFQAGRSNTFSGGAATNVFLTSMISQIHSASQDDKDWGHFTLVKPASNSTTKPGSNKATARPAIMPVKRYAS